MVSRLPPLGVYKGMVPCARSHSSVVSWPVRLLHTSRASAAASPYELRAGELCSCATTPRNTRSLIQATLPARWLMLLLGYTRRGLR